MTIKLKPGLELAFTALCHLAAEHYARGNQVLSAKQMQTRVFDVLATACEIGIADGTVDYNLPQTPSGERFDHKVNK